MDGIKLAQWRKRFEQDISNLQTEYEAFFLDKPLNRIYSINSDESGEWQLKIAESIPNEIKERLQQIFIEAKPEDSI